MMSCKKIQQMLPLYIDDALNTDEKDAVSNHLQECKQCRKSLQELEKISSNISRENFNLEEEYGNQLLVNVNDRIDSRGASGTIRWVAVASSLVIFLLIGIISFNNQAPEISKEESVNPDKYIEMVDINREELYSDNYIMLPEQEYSNITAEIGYTFASSEKYESMEELISLTSEMSEERFNELLVSLKK